MSTGGPGCGHLGKFARRVTFSVNYSGAEERRHSLKAFKHMQSLKFTATAKTQFIKKSLNGGYISPLPFVSVWEAQGQTQSHVKPPALLLGSISNGYHLGFIRLQV